MSYVKNYVANAFNFSGRTTRNAFWVTYLMVLLTLTVIGWIFTILFGEAYTSDEQTTIGVIAGIITFVLTFPAIALQMRRLHDTNHSGAWLLLTFTVIGYIVVLVFLCQAGTVGENKYGPQPLTTD